MELALYEPGHGYYRAARAGPGRGGADFLTAPEAHPIFGAALARPDRGDAGPRLGRPDDFTSASTRPGAARWREALVGASLRSRRPVRGGRARRLPPRGARGPRCSGARRSRSAAPRRSTASSSRTRCSTRSRSIASSSAPDGCASHVRRTGGGFADSRPIPPRRRSPTRLADEGVELAEGQQRRSASARAWLAEVAARPSSAEPSSLVDYGIRAADLYSRAPRRRHPPGYAAPSRRRRPVRARRPPGPHRARRPHGGRGRGSRARLRRPRPRRARPSSSSASAPRTSSSASARTPARGSRTGSRSARPRPAARPARHGGFRVLAFGRGIGRRAAAARPRLPPRRARSDRRRPTRRTLEWPARHVPAVRSTCPATGTVSERGSRRTGPGPPGRSNVRMM